MRKLEVLAHQRAINPTPIGLNVGIEDRDHMHGRRYNLLERCKRFDPEWLLVAQYLNPGKST